MVASATSTQTPAVSLKQLRANRRNARKSTGPKTAAGKAASSKNAMKHGLCSADIVVEGEDRGQYSELRIEMIRWTHPRNLLELEFAEQIIRAAWKLRRLQGAETTLYRDRARALRQKYENEPFEPGWVLGDMLWDDAEFRGFGRYERQLTSMMHRAMDQLRKLRKDDLPGILPDFAGEEIEREQARMENEQNEPNCDKPDANDGGETGCATDRAQMDTDKAEERERIDGLNDQKGPETGDSGG